MSLIAELFEISLKGVFGVMDLWSVVINPVHVNYRTSGLSDIFAQAIT